jgi:THO complex subunit 2
VPHPFISDGVHRLLHVAIESIYAPYSPSRRFSSQTSGSSNARRRRAVANRNTPGLLDFVDTPDRKSVRGYDPFPKQDVSDRTVRFFLDEDFWTNDIPICQTIDDFFVVVRNFLKFSGPRLGNDVRLLVKLVRIGKNLFAKVEPYNAGLMS